MVQTISRSLAIVIFGVVLPIFLLVQAYVGLSKAETLVRSSVAGKSAAESFADARRNLHDANDYALYSVIAAERTNQIVVTNKQVMKIAVMQIGLAVVSLGIMFVVLGFRDGGAETGIEAQGVRFDFKTGSTGAVVFVIGAAMAAAAGIMKNDYNTVPIPGYIQTGESSGSIAHVESLNLFRKCSNQNKISPYECFYKFFEKEFSGEVK